MINELTFSVSDEPGSLHVVLRALADAKVNVRVALALGGTFADFAVIVLICDEVDRAMVVLRENSLKYQKREVFAVGLVDEPGHLAHVAGVLASAGINLRHLYHTEYVSPNDVPLTILSLSDNALGMEVLRKHHFEVFDSLPTRSVSDNRHGG